MKKEYRVIDEFGLKRVALMGFSDDGACLGPLFDFQETPGESIEELKTTYLDRLEAFKRPELYLDCGTGYVEGEVKNGTRDGT